MGLWETGRELEAGGLGSACGRAQTRIVQDRLGQELRLALWPRKAILYNYKHGAHAAPGPAAARTRAAAENTWGDRYVRETVS